MGYGVVPRPQQPQISVRAAAAVENRSESVTVRAVIKPSAAERASPVVLFSSKSMDKSQPAQVFGHAPGDANKKMKATTLLSWLKNRPRYSLAIILAAACSYAIDRCFFSGLLEVQSVPQPNPKHK